MMIKTEDRLLYEVIAAFVPGLEQEEKDRDRMLQLLEAETDLLTRENQLYHFTASAWAVNEAKTAVLMVFHNIYNAWSWVGGHADGESDLLAVAHRELKEETGIKKARALQTTPISLELLWVQAHEKKRRYVAPHLHLNLTYWFEVEENQTLIRKPDENKGVAWRTPKEIRADQSEPHMKPIYEKLMDRTMINP